MLEALLWGHDQIKKIIELQDEFIALSKPEKMTVVLDIVTADIKDFVFNTYEKENWSCLHFKKR
jgi:polyribonucleotide nucleotidyltransferase